MLADEADFVIGVDTHKDTHTAVIADPAGMARREIEVSANPGGYRYLLKFACEHAPGIRVWAIEGTGSYGAGLTAHLTGQGERIIEIDRPKRRQRPGNGKSDSLDAHRAAREALSEKHPAIPRRHGERQALQLLLSTRRGAVTARTKAICALKAALIAAPETLRGRLRGISGRQLVNRCSRLRVQADQPDGLRGSIICLRALARRALTLEAEAAALQAEIEPLVKEICPELLHQFGVGPISAAQILVSWSHHGRIRNEAAFASLAGAAPIPASSGKTVRHRLNRGGDRQLNHALHTVILSRIIHHPETRTYVENKTSEGKTIREIRRSLVRYLARQIYRLLETRHPETRP